MQQYQEGMTATGPNGETAVYRGGQWVVVPAQAQGPMTIGTPDPAFSYKAPMAAADLVAKQAEASTAPYRAREAAASATKAEIDAEKARRDLAAQMATAGPEQQRQMADLANDEVLSAIARARQDLQRSGSAGFAARLPEFAQPQSAIDLGGSLNTIASRLTLDKLAQLKQASPTGASGLGSLTEKEGALLRDSVAALGQTQSPERLAENLAAVELHYRNLLALSHGDDYRDPKVAARYGIAPMPEQPQAMTLAQGGYREEADPALRGVNAHIRGMIGAGKSSADIVAYMNSVQPGLGDEKAADVAATVDFRKQNPTVPLDRYAVSVENRQVPLSATRDFVNRAAQSPFGAYAMSATDALTGGTVDNLTDNPALARAGMAAVSQQYPKSSIAGSITGGAISAAGLENAVGGLGLKWAPRVGDALYGAAYGAGSADEGNRLTGALQGAAVGTLGGMVGRKATRAVGKTLTGVRDASAQYLRDANVPLTLGQAVANSGRLGRYIKGREDRLAGFSGIGDRINGLRRNGMEAFNRAGFREGLEPIGGQIEGQLGEQAVEQTDNLVSNAYDRALNPVRLQADDALAAGMRPIVSRARDLPGEMADNARYTLEQRVGQSIGPNGEMSGRDFQQAVRGLEQDARAVRNLPYGNDFGNIARDARGELEGMLERQSPGSLDDYLAANAAYRNHSILADAVASGMNTDGLFTPAQLGQAARANARKYTGRISAATTDRPFYDLQRAGQQILPSKVPDSGTAGRAAAEGGLTSTLRAMARNTLNAPLYAEGAQGAINAALLDRPEIAIRLGNQVAKRARLGGIFGAPIALQYSPMAVAPAY